MHTRYGSQKERNAINCEATLAKLLKTCAGFALPYITHMASMAKLDHFFKRDWSHVGSVSRVTGAEVDTQLTKLAYTYITLYTQTNCTNFSTLV